MIRSLLSCFAFVVLAASVLGPPAPAQNPLGRKSSSEPAKADPLVGEWRGDGLVVQFELKKAGKKPGYQGEIRLDAAAYPMTCTLSGQKSVAGNFRVEGERFAFVGELAGDALTLESEGSVYRLERTRKASRNPLAPKAGRAGGAGTSAPGQLGAAAGTAALKMKTFTHPRGFKFQHPEGWRVESAEEGIMVLPAGVEQDAQGQPLEMFVLGGEDAEGMQRPDQPEVLAWFDGQMAQMFPAMKRGGKTESLTTLLGPGAILHYTGKMPTGIDGAADVYVTLHSGLGLFMLHLGRTDLVAAHQAQGRRMFSSFGWTKGKVDPSLVGLWHRGEYESTGGLDSVGASTNIYWEFRQDGSVGYASGSRLFGQVGGVSIHDEGGDPNQWAGMWSAQAKQVTVQWNQGGVEQYEYSVFAHTEGQTGLKLTTPGEEKGTFFIRQ